MSCEYCQRAWKPLFRIIESYPCDEVDIHGHCDGCEHQQEVECWGCEFAPIEIRNKLNLTIYIESSTGELVFEDKVNMKDNKQRLKINYCPVCGGKLGGGR